MIDMTSQRTAKAKVIVYWISTMLVVAVMAISGGMSIVHAAPMMKGLAHLGYPPYFVNLLGFGKAAGVCVFLMPGMPKLKEWAYVGFGITIISAAYSHLLSGDGWMALDPLFFFALLITSYLTRSARQGLAFRDANRAGSETLCLGKSAGANLPASERLL